MHNDYKNGYAHVELNMIVILHSVEIDAGRKILLDAVDRFYF